MLKLRSTILAGLFCTVSIFAAETVKLTDPAFLDDFNDKYGDKPNQNTLGAVYGCLSHNGCTWLGGGYWFYFADKQGSSVKNSKNEEIIQTSGGIEGTEVTMIPDSTLHVFLITSTSKEKYSYAAVGCNLIGSDRDDQKFLDLSKMTAISMKIKGNILNKGKGNVRMHLETKNYYDAKASGKTGFDWGYYGKVLTVASNWSEIVIPLEDLIPEEWSPASEAGWKWEQGNKEVIKLAFKAKDSTDVELFVDDIKFVGMTYGDFGFKPANVITSRYNKQNNVFSVNGSSISFKLKQAEDLNVSLNDIMGNQVRTLFTGKTAGATYSLDGLSSGRYLAVISGKSVNCAQSIVITK